MLMAMDDAHLANDLERLLEPRKQWRLEPNEDSVDGPFWAIGKHGAAHAAISVVDGQYLVYVHESDSDFFLSTIEEVEEWVVANEEQLDELTPFELELIRYLSDQMDPSPGSDT